MSDSLQIAFVPVMFVPLTVSCRQDWHNSSSIGRLLTPEEMRELRDTFGLNWRTIEFREVESVRDVLRGGMGRDTRRTKEFVIDTTFVKKGEEVLVITIIKGRDHRQITFRVDIPFSTVTAALAASDLMRRRMMVVQLLGYMEDNYGDPEVKVLYDNLVAGFEETHRRLTELNISVSPTTPTSTDVKPEETVQKVESAATDVKPGTDGAEVTEAQPVKKLAPPPKPPHQKPRLIAVGTMTKPPASTELESNKNPNKNPKKAGKKAEDRAGATPRTLSAQMAALKLPVAPATTPAEPVAAPQEEAPIATTSIES